MRSGNQAPHTAPRNVYACADGGYLAMSGSMQSMAERILDTIGRPELKTDPRFRTNDDRVANRDELDAIIGAHVGREQPGREPRPTSSAAGVPVAPVVSMADLVADPYVHGPRRADRAGRRRPRLGAHARDRAAPRPHARHIPPAGAEARRAHRGDPRGDSASAPRKASVA